MLDTGDPPGIVSSKLFLLYFSRRETNITILHTARPSADAHVYIVYGGECLFSLSLCLPEVYQQSRRSRWKHIGKVPRHCHI